MIQVTNGEKTITTTPKMFETVYKLQGFEMVIEVVESETPKNENLQELTVPQLKILAKEKGLTGTSNLNKEELIALLSNLNEA